MRPENKPGSVSTALIDKIRQNRDAMKNSGVYKPPLAPKPKLVDYHRPGLSPSTPRRDNLSLLSPSTQRRVKPLLAPKPCLSKLTTAVEYKPLAPKGPDQTPARENKGLLNSQNGLQQENKKPDWDYIIPICLCSHENCVCLRNQKMEKDFKTYHKAIPEENVKLLPASRGTADKSEEKCRVTNASHKPLKETFTLDENLNTDVNRVTVRPSLPNRTWSDEANGNVTPHSSPGPGPEEDALGSEQMSCVARPKAFPAAPRKPIPVPVPRKPRTSVQARQEKEEDREEMVGQDVREMNVEEGKGGSLLSVSVPVAENKQTVFLSARRACPAPAPPPRKKPLLSTPEKAPTTSAPLSMTKDVLEEDLGWDSSVHEMEVSVDEEEVEVEKERTHSEKEASCSHFTHSLPSSGSSNPPKLSCLPPVAVAAEDVATKVAPKKPKRHSGPMAWMQRRRSSEEREEGKSGDDEYLHVLPIQDCASKESVMRRLPSPPQKPQPIIKPSLSSWGKQKSKSFSSADLIRSDGRKRNSFRKLLELKMSMMMLPKLMAKGGQSPDNGEEEQSVHRDFHERRGAERKVSCPLIGVEQNVDGDEVFAGGNGDIFYQNIPHYEEIPDYVNVGTAEASPLASFSQPAAWHDDEGIYEEQEPYMCFEKNTGHLQCPTPDYERISVDEEVAPLDDDIFSSEEEEDEGDSSSVSSKGQPEEQPEESTTKSGQNKSKIHHIATEIMSSESVFVDVIKLLHVDFRDAVSKASSQSGKPVIEERLLNQILYSLPQLYELNQDLLKELEQRVAKWDERAQLADIFLKKGPYLKMYSTYIREFGKNVALLEEQSKKNLAFGAVVREFQASPRCANIALKHYLLKPVQRIPQYQLLLTDYLKNLSEDSDDYKDTQAALALMKEVANHANDTVKQGDDFEKLIQVQCRLNGHHEIVLPGRILLKEGVLKKLSRKVMQPRMFFLFNDILLYTTPVQSGQYKLNNMLDLAGMKVSKPSQEACQNELKIESVQRSFILSASSASERDEWLEAISTAICDYTRKKISFISGKPPEEVDLSECGDDAALGSKAPIWIPDPRTTMCMICTCEFTLTWRRHHCRACGKVVCQACSPKKHCLEYLNNTLARVCNQCFPILQEQKSEQALAAAVSPGSRATFAFTRKQKKIPAALKEVTANTDNSSMSGYLQRSKGNKKQGKRLWFVIKDKVLYTYAASEDVAALESQPLLGFMLTVDSSHKLQFKLFHKNTLYYIYKADDVQTAQRWIDTFKEAMVL